MNEIFVAQVGDLPPSVVGVLETWRSKLKDMKLVTQVIDPEIRKFEEWFQVPARGNGPLTTLERELLRSYLYQKLTGTL